MSDLPPPDQPYRSVALLHAALAAVILVVAGLSGGDLLKAVATAIRDGSLVAAVEAEIGELR